MITLYNTRPDDVTHAHYQYEVVHTSVNTIISTSR